MDNISVKLLRDAERRLFISGFFINWIEQHESKAEGGDDEEKAIKA
jgi:hypothetical protein